MGRQVDFNPSAKQLLTHNPLDQIDVLTELKKGVGDAGGTIRKTIEQLVGDGNMDFGALGEALFGIPGLDQAGFATVAARWLTLLGNPALGGGFDPDSAWATIITTYLNPSGLLTAVLDPDAPLDARNLVNFIDPARMPVVPVSSITDTSPNLVDGGFDSASTGVDLGHQGWSWSGADGHKSAGCWQVVPDGTVKTFESPPAAVTAGQTVPVLGWAKHVGTSAASLSNGVRITVRAYRANAANNLELVSETMAAAIPSPSGSSSSVDPADHDFVLLAGVFTVPAGVDAVSTMFVVTPAVVGGVVKFDDGSLTKTSLLPQHLVDQLPADLLMIRDRAQAIVDASVQALLDVVTVGHTSAELKAALTSFPRLTSLYDVVGGAPGAGVAAIGARLAALAANGQLDAAALTNLAQLPNIPNGLGKIGDLQAVNDNLTNALSGNSLTGIPYTGTGLGAAKVTMESLFAQLSTTTRRVQALESQQAAAVAGGTQFTTNFADYPDGPFPAGLFTLTYTGPGSSRLAISGGRAVWNLVNDGNVTALLRYPSPTLTDYQIVRGVMASAPENNSAGQKPRIWALARMNAAGTDFVFARGYCTGFLTYRGDIGCYKGGVEYVWQSNVPLTWALDMRLICGVGINPRRHIVLSGETTVVDYTETVGQSGGLSVFDSSHLFWGSRSDTNGVNTPGAVAGSSVVDNAPPAVVGSTFRASRRSGSDVTIVAGTATKVPNNFYETVDYISPDMTYAPGTNCRLTVTKQGTYLVQYRTLHGLYLQGTGGHAVLLKNGSIFARGHWGDTPNSFNAVASSTDATAGSFIVALNPGDYIEPAWRFTADMFNTGDPARMANGSEAYFSVTRVGVG